MTSLLLLGVNGQVGHELAGSLAPLGELVIPERSSYDFADGSTLDAMVAHASPDVIVNAAAYTAVDRAESDVATATAVNAEAPGHLARAAKACGALLVHYSTDYVYDGAKTAPYDEDDATRPLGVYGRTKLEGEKAIRASGADHVIFRASWLYSTRGQNFLMTMLRLAAEREQLRVVDDQIGAPTWARTIAKGTAAALAQDLALRRSGTFESAVIHLTAAGATSWHGFASAIVAGARARGAQLACREVLPIPTSAYPTAAVRPANSRLAGDRLHTRYGLALPAWDEALGACLDEMLGPVRP